MSKRIVKYNPAFLSNEELVRSFVVRHAELKLIVQVIRENVTNSNQHILVIGPRGVGKTMLVLRVAEEIRIEKDLTESWYPLVFSEESYQVTTPGEFWLEALFHLGQKTGEDRWKQTYKELSKEQDENRLRERALGQLMDFADTQGKRILLIVENFNMMLGEQLSDKDGWALRHTLLNESRIMLLATATSRFEEVDNCGKPMFELFRPIELKPIGDQDCLKIWNYVTGQKLRDERIRPLKILTGGNPRLLTIVSNFAVKMSLRELMNDLMQLVDEHTEYFKSHLDNLPAIERKVYLGLAELWHPATAREVANLARLNVNKTSSLLRRLMERGAVVLADGHKRTRQYHVAERMYNIYYLMRRRGQASSRVRALVRFMVHFYGQEEIIGLTQRIAEEACEIDPLLRKDHYIAYEGILECIGNHSLRQKLIQAVPHEFFAMPDTPHEIKCLMKNERLEQVESANSDVRIALKEGSALEDLGEFEKAKRVYQRITEENSESGAAWARLGYVLHTKLGKYEKAEEAYRMATELNPDAYCTWVRLGQLLDRHFGRYEEAEKAYKKGVKLQPNCPLGWSCLGDLLREKLGRYEEAEKAYKKVIEIDEKNGLAWVGLALIHEKAGRFDEAEEAHKKAVALKPDDHLVWEKFGRFLHQYRVRFVEAEHAYRKAIDIGSDCCLIWEYLGELLEEFPERYEEAEKAYRKAIEIKEKYTRAWAHLAQLLDEKLERYEEAEKAYRKVIELEPEVAWGYAKIGQLLHEKLERYEQAEKAYRKIIELEPEAAWGYVKIGQLLNEKLDRPDEAETAFHKAIEIDPKNIWALDELTVLLLTKLGRTGEAAQLAKETLAHEQENTMLLNNFAWAFYKYGSLDLLPKAEEWARDAVRLEKESGHCHNTLASIMCKLGKGREALQNAKKYVEDKNLVEKTIEDAIDLFIGLAANGVGKEALKILQESPSSKILEPLVVGLQLFVGEDVNAAAEIMEVAKDVVKRIEARQNKKKSKKHVKSKAKRHIE